MLSKVLNLWLISLATKKINSTTDGIAELELNSRFILFKVRVDLYVSPSNSTSRLFNFIISLATVDDHL